MNKLKDISTEEIKAELLNREKTENFPPNKKPWNGCVELEKVITDYIAFVASEEYHEDNDYEHYIYEAALETFYDKNELWEFINSRMV